MCEDVREEVGNKFSAMGIFGGDIVTSPFPAVIRAAFLLIFSSNKNGELELRMRLSVDGTVVMEAKASVNFETAGTANMVIPMGAIRVEKPSRIALQLSMTGDDWVDAISKEVLDATSQK